MEVVTSELSQGGAALGSRALQALCANVENEVKEHWTKFTVDMNLSHPVSSIWQLSHSAIQILHKLAAQERNHSVDTRLPSKENVDDAASLLSLEMIHLLIMTLSGSNGEGVVNQLNDKPRKTKASKQKVSEKSTDDETVDVGKNAYTMAMATLSTLEAALSGDTSNNTVINTQSDVFKWLERLAEGWGPLVRVLIKAVSVDTRWNDESQDLNRLVRFTYSYLSVFLQLSQRQEKGNHKRLLTLFCSSKGQVLQNCLALMDAMDGLGSSVTSNIDTVPNNGAFTDGKRRSAISWKQCILSSVRHLLEAVLMRDKDVDELAVVAQLHVGEVPSQNKYKSANNKSSHKSNDNSKESGAPADKASYYQQFYDCIKVYSTLTQTAPVSHTTDSDIAYTGPARLLRLYLLSSLRVALSDKLDIDTVEDTAPTYGGAAVARATSAMDKSTIESHLAAGRALELLPFVSNAATARKHILKLLQVGYAMLQHIGVGNESDSPEETIYKTYCRMRLLEQLSWALQGSIPNHPTLEPIMAKYAILCKQCSERLLAVCKPTNMNDASSKRSAMQATLELRCLRYYAKLDHRFILGSHEDITVSTNSDDMVTEEPEKKPEGLLGCVYESLLICTGSTSNADFNSLRSAQSSMLLFLIELHSQLSRLDIFVTDLCTMCQQLPLEAEHLILLHDLLNSTLVQTSLLTSFSAAPEVQRAGVWDCLTNGTNLNISASLQLLPLIVRPLSNAHSTRGTLRGGGTFLSPPARPVAKLLDMTTTHLKKLMSSENINKEKQHNKKQSKSSYDDSGDGECGPILCASSATVSLLSVAEKAIAKIAPNDVEKWQSVAISAISLVKLPIILSPLSAMSKNVGPRQASTAIRLLVSATTFSATAQLRLSDQGSMPELDNNTVLQDAVRKTVCSVCELPVDHVWAKDLIHVLTQLAPCWTPAMSEESSRCLVVSNLGNLLCYHASSIEHILSRASVRDVPLFRLAIQEILKSRMKQLEEKKPANLTSIVDQLSWAVKYVNLPSDESEKRSIICDATTSLQAVSKLLSDTTKIDDTQIISLEKALSVLSSIVVKVIHTPSKGKGDKANLLEETECLWKKGNRTSSSCDFLQAVCSMTQPVGGPVYCPHSTAAGSEPSILLASLTLDALCVKSFTQENKDSPMLWILEKLLEQIDPDKISVNHMWAIQAIWRSACNALSSADWQNCEPGTFLHDLGGELLGYFHKALLKFMKFENQTADYLMIVADLLRIRTRVHMHIAAHSADSISIKCEEISHKILCIRPTASGPKSTPLYGWLAVLGMHLHCMRMEGKGNTEYTARNLANELGKALSEHSASHVPPQNELSMAVSGILLTSPGIMVSSICSIFTENTIKSASQHAEGSLLALRVAAAIAHTHTLSPKHTGSSACFAVRFLLGRAPTCVVKNTQSRKRARVTDDLSIGIDDVNSSESSISDHTFYDITSMFFEEAAGLLQMLLAFLQTSGSGGGKKRTAGDGDEQGANWATSCLSLVSVLSSIATSTFLANPQASNASNYSIHTLRAVEKVLLSSMSSSTLSNAASGPLLAATTQAIHIALHCASNDVNTALAVANRTLLAASTCRPFNMHVYHLLATILDTAGYSSSPVVLQRLTTLHPGLFALLDCCADPKSQKHLQALLGEQARAVYNEIHDRYVREYKFKGRV